MTLATLQNNWVSNSLEIKLAYSCTSYAFLSWATTDRMEQYVLCVCMLLDLKNLGNGGNFPCSCLIRASSQLYSIELSFQVGENFVIVYFLKFRLTGF